MIEQLANSCLLQLYYCDISLLYVNTSCFMSICANLHVYNSERSAYVSHCFTADDVHFTARHSYASAVLGVVILSVHPSVRPFVRLSVTRVLCDKTKQCIADILIAHERAIILVFLHQQWLVGLLVTPPSV